MILLFSIFFSSSFVAYHVFIENDYKSTIKIQKNTAFTYWNYIDFMNFVYGSCEDAALVLRNNHVCYSNGSAIVAADLSNLSFVPHDSNSNCFSFSLLLPEKDIIAQALNTLAELSVDKVFTKKGDGTKMAKYGFEGIAIAEVANQPVLQRNMGSEIVFSLLLALTFSICISFIAEACDGTIYWSYDLLDNSDQVTILVASNSHDIWGTQNAHQQNNS